jgi:hypothetical protein
MVWVLGTGEEAIADFDVRPFVPGYSCHLVRRVVFLVLLAPNSAAVTHECQPSWDRKWPY